MGIIDLWKLKVNFNNYILQVIFSLPYLSWWQEGSPRNSLGILRKDIETIILLHYIGGRVYWMLSFSQFWAEVPPGIHLRIKMEFWVFWFYLPCSHQACRFSRMSLVLSNRIADPHASVPGLWESVGLTQFAFFLSPAPEPEVVHAPYSWLQKGGGLTSHPTTVYPWGYQWADLHNFVTLHIITHSWSFTNLSH